MPYVVGLVAIACVLAAIGNALAMRYPKPYGIFSICFVILYIIGTIILMCIFVRPDPVFIIVGILVVAIECWTLYQFQKYAAMACELIGVCREVGTVHTGIYKLAAATIVSQFIWMAAYVSVTSRTLAMFEGAGYFAVLVHSIFTWYWVAETIRNTVHVSVAGSLATWYFAGDDFAQRNPTWQSFKRASTYSAGSIMFASLLVAILMTLRRLFRLLQMRNNRNVWLMILSIVARIFLVVIEALLRFFNKFALTIVAIEGESYWRAIKKTSALLGENGFEMVMQNNITVSIIAASTLMSGFTCAGIGALMAHAAGLHILPLAIAGLVVGFVIVEGAFVMIESGSISVLMCWLMYPEKLRQSRPQLYAMLAAAEESYGGDIARREASTANV